MNRLTKKALLMDVNSTKIIKVSGYPENMLKQLPEDNVTDDGKVKIEIRMLSDGELNEAEDTALQGVSMNQQKLKLGSKKTGEIKRLKARGASDEEIAEKLEQDLDINVDVKQMKSFSKLADYKICAFALSVGNEKWTVDDVKKMPRGVPSQIADEAKKISTFVPTNKEDEGDLDNFRKE